MQESRWLRIVYYLLDKGHATAYELAEEFEVSTRTIYRDIDVLSDAGIPVYAEPGRNGGIYLMSEFILDRSILSEKEQQDVLTALQSINAILYSHDNATWNKLSAFFHISLENWLEVDFSRWGDKKGDNKKFDSLKSAVLYHKKVKILYASSYVTVREGVIQPLKLMYKSRGWYLKAFCQEKQEYRLFKLTRILEYTVLNEMFVPQFFPVQQDTLQQEYNQIILRFPKEMAYRVYDEFDITQIERQDNGDLLVSAKMPEDDWLISFLLSFGTQVEIIEPEYLRESIAEQARCIYEKIKQGKGCEKLH